MWLQTGESKVGLLKSPVSESLVVRKSNAEVEAMRRQSKGLAQEYDRLLTEHHQLQVHFHKSVEIHFLLLKIWIILRILDEMKHFIWSAECSEHRGQKRPVTASTRQRQFWGGPPGAVPSLVQRGSQRPSLWRNLFHLSWFDYRETKLWRHIRRLRVPAPEANTNWWMVWLGDYYFWRRDCALLCCSICNNTGKCLYVVHSFRVYLKWSSR